MNEHDNKELEQVRAAVDSACEADLDQLLREGAEALGAPMERELRESMRTVMGAPHDAVAPKRPSLVHKVLAGAGWMSIAASTLLVVWLIRGDRGPSRPPLHSRGIQLGPGAERLAEPSGPVGDFDAFRWDLELPAGGWFELSIWDGQDAPESEPRFAVETESSPWTPTDEQRRALPSNIRWQVRAIDMTGTVRSSVSAQAERP